MTIPGWHIWINNAWQGPVKEHKLRAAIASGEVGHDVKVKSAFGEIMTIAEAFPDLSKSANVPKAPALGQTLRQQEAPVTAAYQQTFIAIRSVGNCIAAIAILDCAILIYLATAGGITPELAGGLVGAHVVSATFMWTVLYGISHIGDAVLEILSNQKAANGSKEL